MEKQKKAFFEKIDDLRSLGEKKKLNNKFSEAFLEEEAIVEPEPIVEEIEPEVVVTIPIEPAPKHGSLARGPHSTHSRLIESSRTSRSCY